MSTTTSTSKPEKKKRSSRRHRSPSPDSSSGSYSDSEDSISPARQPRRSKTTKVVATRPERPSRSTRAVYSDDEDYRRSRRHRDRDSDRHGTNRSYYEDDDKPSRRRRDEYYDDDSHDGRRDRRRHRRNSYDSESDVSDYESSNGRRKKNIIEDVMGAIGLLGAEKAITSKRDRSRDRSPRGSSSRGDRRVSRQDREEINSEKKKQALQAAVTAAAIEAWRVRKDKESTTAQRMMRIASAAVAAGGLDALVDTKPGDHSMRHIAEAIVGGLVTSKTVGPQIRRTGGVRQNAMDGIVGKVAKSTMNKLRSGSSGGGRSSSMPRSHRS